MTDCRPQVPGRRSGTPIYRRHPGKEQWRETAAYIGENDLLGKGIIVFDSGIYPRKTFEYYYPGSIEKFSFENGKDYQKKVQQLGNSYDYAYLVVSHNYETKELYKSLFDKIYQPLESREFVGIKVYKYDLRKKQQ